MQGSFDAMYSVILEIFDWIIKLGTLISIIIAIFSLREIRAQRENSMMPDIQIEMKQNSIELKRVINKKNTWTHYHWNSDSIDEKNDSNSNQYYFKLVNIGFGSAKNVIVKWDFDREFFTDILENLSSKEFAVKKNPGRIDMWEFTSEKTQAMVLDQGYEYKYNYIPSLEIDPEGKMISIPTLFQSLFSVCLYNQANRKDEDNHQNPEFHFFLQKPILKLYISYQDIAGKKYVNNQEILFTIVALSIDDCRMTLELVSCQDTKRLN